CSIIISGVIPKCREHVVKTSRSLRGIRRLSLIVFRSFAGAVVEGRVFVYAGFAARLAGGVFVFIFFYTKSPAPGSAPTLIPPHQHVQTGILEPGSISLC